MKKIIILMSISLLTMALLGCNQETESSNPKKPYHSEEAIKNGDIVNFHGEISNIDRFEQFLENLKNDTKDEIRMTSYTEEGDPVFYNLTFDGYKIQYTYDDSQDGFAGSNKGVKSTSCSNIETQHTEMRALYVLSGCSSDIGNTFYLPVPEK